MHDYVATVVMTQKAEHVMQTLQSSPCMTAGRDCKLACASHDKRLMAYTFIHSIINLLFVLQAILALNRLSCLADGLKSDADEESSSEAEMSADSELDSGAAAGVEVRVKSGAESRKVSGSQDKADDASSVEHLHGLLPRTG